ncbi:hypothetical protein ACTJJT_00960 [Pseudomonas sp. 22373]|nr:hypothetical protein [Pseudomonas putida]POF97099.1 hypothetical protein BGP81_10315 [Pseudomonas putida]WVM65227.1 hypothetical protein V1687_17125 [Pseudomonas putida]
MRKQVGYRDKMGDEQFYYLEFDENTYQFSYVIEYISRTNNESSRKMPLHEASGERGFHKAVELIKSGLFGAKAD